MTPMSRTTPMSCIQHGSWGSAMGEGVTTVRLCPARSQTVFGPSPTTCRAYAWPRPRGSCRCTKGGVLFCTPLLVRGQLEPRLRTHLAGQRKEAKPQDNQSNARPETRRAERRGELPWQGPCRGGLHSPGNNLAGATCPTPAEPPPLSPRAPTPSTTLEPMLRRYLHGGLQNFVETKNMQD